jgi:transcriptional regulator with PAS, ATPase and Fis domain
MTLSEAKEILNKFINQSKDYLLSIKDDGTQFTRNNYVEMCEQIKAIETVLKALEDSIPKEKVRKKIEEYVNRRKELANGHFWENESNINEDTALVIAIETLRHLEE